MKFKAFSWKQTSLVQMRAQTCMHVRYTTLGLREAVPYTNQSKAPVKNSAVPKQRGVLHPQLYRTLWFAIPFVATEISRLTFTTLSSLQWQYYTPSYEDWKESGRLIYPTLQRQINLSCITYFVVLEGVPLMDDFSHHAATSSTFTYCSTYAVHCKLALRQ